MLEYVRILIDAQRARMDERGASAVEYGLLVGGIAAVMVAIVFFLGDNIKELFTTTCTAVDGKTTAGTGNVACS